jgi:hypothetical protein
VIYDWEWPPASHVPGIWSYKVPGIQNHAGPEIKSEMLMDHWWNGHFMVDPENQTTGRSWCAPDSYTPRKIAERFWAASTVQEGGGPQKEVCLPHWTFDSTPKKVGNRFELLEHQAELGPLKGWGIYVEEGFKISWEASLIFFLISLGFIGLAGGLAKHNHNLAYLGVAGLPLPILGYFLTIYITARRG